jgi:enterochelin esterase-like enzyme
VRPSFKAILAFVLVVFAAEAADKKRSEIRVELPLGPGHMLSVRGSGGGLSWGDSRAATETSPGVWTLALDLEHPIELKLVLDGSHWMAGSNVTLAPGQTLTLVEPEFDVDSHGRIESRMVGDRLIHVYLPPGYQRGAGPRYPVIYMQDGDKLFGQGSSGWHAQDTADQMILQGRLPPSVIVGIPPWSPEQRMHEYTPFQGVLNMNGDKAGGGLFDYAKYLVEQVKSEIDRSYDTLTGLLDTKIGGSSLGGEASLVIAVTYPETFGDVIGMSGSWFWGEVVRNEHGQVVRAQNADPSSDIQYQPHYSVAQYIREQLERNRKAGKPAPRVFLSVGTDEDSALHRGIEVMANQLHSIGYEFGKNLFLYVNPMGRHREQSWAWQFKIPLTWLKSRNSCRDCLLPHPHGP